MVIVKIDHKDDPSNMTVDDRWAKSHEKYFALASE